MNQLARRTGWRLKAGQVVLEGLPTGLFTLFVLYIGFGDGLNYWRITPWLNLRSPLTFVFPLLVGAMVLTWLRLDRLPSLGAQLSALIVVSVLAASAIVEELLGKEQNLLGLVQLAVFGVLLILIRALFTRCGERTEKRTINALTGVHYFLCGYVVVSFVAWHLLGTNLNVATFAAETEYYGFRPSAFGYEPSWTAFGIATTLLAIFYLAPSRRLLALLAMAVAVVLLTSMAGYLFLVAFALAHVMERRNVGQWGLALLAATVVATVGFYAYRDRIVMIVSGTDPSILMRFSSAQAAMDIIRGSFPLGVGYGNFQQYASYTDPFVLTGLHEGTLQFYKSDMFLLNVIAELGVFGVLYVLAVAKTLTCRRYRLPLVFLLFIGLAAGTILIQATLVIAAIVGMLEGRGGSDLSVKRKYA